MTTALKLLSSMATKHVLPELVAAYAKTTAKRVEVEPVGGIGAASRVRSGEAFDLVLLATDVMRKLANEGHIDPSSLVEFAKSSTAMALPTGVATPAACDEATIRDLLARSKTIGVSTGPSGTNVRTLLQSWGMTGPAAPRIVEAPPGVPVASLLAAGKAAVGFQQLSELLGQPGIQIVGVVPESVLPTTLFSIGICTRAVNAAAASRLAQFLTSSAAGDAKLRHGFQT